MFKNKPQFNEQNVEEATEKLHQVMAAISAFDTFYKTLSSQEKSVVGGITFHLVSIWGDFHLMGAIVDRAYGAMMINQLANFFNNPQQESSPVSGVRPFTKADKDGKIN